VDIVVPDGVNLEPLEQKVAKTTGPLQKDMRRLIAARSQVKRMPGMRSGRLHSPNLHRIMAGDDRVFTRREEAPSLDTAISLVIDCSGSMNGNRMVLATETAYAIGSVLARLNVAFECLGFTDNGSDPRVATKEYKQALAEADAIAKIIRPIPIVMPKFKTFDERWTQPTQRRFAHVFNQLGYSDNCGFKMGSTPEGCGIEFAARRLVARPEQRKIMLVMTDGEPCGHVYNPRGMEDYHAYQRQSEQVVKAIAAAGIDLVGIGIQHNGPEGYYPHHMTIQDVSEMPKQLLQLLKKFMTGN
jgi:cobalamin biosynthesis protein CobT